jgi:lipopolysaccharide export system ATP-binding protein
MLLDARHLTKRYGKKPVVNDVSIEVGDREIVGLLGANGAGKTTTFSMIMGLLRPDSGAIVFDGEDVTHHAVARRARYGLGYLAQEPSVFRKLSVRDNIIAVLEWIPELTRGERLDRMERILAEMRLSKLATQKAALLSGGERRRLEISRLLVTEPRLLLLDEPFSGVDPIAVEEIKDIVTHLRTRGMALLITDHNVRETLSITDRSYIVHEGRVLKQGSARMLVQDEDVKRAYLGRNFSMPELLRHEPDLPAPVKAQTPLRDAGGEGAGAA